METHLAAHLLDPAMRLGYAALGVVLVVLLTGCNGADPGANGTDAITNGTAAPNATETTATESGGETDPSDLPPGVSESGPIEASALERANRQALTDSGFRAELAWNVTATNRGQTQEVDQHFESWAAAGGQPYRTRLIQDSASGSANVRTWSNETVRYRYAEQTSRLRGRQVTAARAYDPRPTPSNGAVSTLFSVVEWGNYTVESAEQTGDGTRITLTADDGGTGTQGLTVDSYDGEIVVDSAGRVHEASITVNATTARGAQSDSTITYDLTETGDRTIAEPGWVPPVLSDTPNVRLETTVVDGNYVRVDHTAGVTLENGTRIGLIDVGTGGRYAQLSESVSPGETVYVYREPGTSQTLVSLEEPSGQFRSVNATQRVFVSSGGLNTTSVNVTLADG